MDTSRKAVTVQKMADDLSSTPSRTVPITELCDLCLELGTLNTAQRQGRCDRMVDDPRRWPISS